MASNNQTAPATSNLRDETLTIEIVQQKAGNVLSRRIPIEYPNLTNAEANGLNFLLCEAVDMGLGHVIVGLATMKSAALGQTEQWKQFLPLIEEALEKRGMK